MKNPLFSPNRRFLQNLARRLLAGLGLIFLADTTPLLADTILLTGSNSIDAVVDSRFATTNFGTQTYLYAGHTDGFSTNNAYSYLQFDPTGMPAAASSVQLYLYRNGGAATSGTPVQAYVVTGTWTETGITYNTRPANQGTALTSTSVGANGAYYAFDITDAYNQWKSNPSTNFGLVFTSNPANNECFSFASSENGSTIQPYLVITPAAPQSFVLTGSNSIDAVVDSRFATTNFGTQTYLYAGHTDGFATNNAYSYLKVDLTGMPDSATLAQLQLYRNGGGATTGTPVEVYVVTGTWTETGITYNTIPSSQGAPVASTSVGATGTFYSFDITEAYNQWKSNPAANFGVVLKSNPANNECFSFASSENGVTIQPRLVVTAGSTPWTPADLGERVWLDWWASDVASGTVSQWTSRQGSVAAAQANAGERPVKQSDEVFFDNGRRLKFPAQDVAYIAHRAIMLLFRIDLTGSGDGSIFSVNGITGGNDRQPYIGYDRGTNQVQVQWKTPSSYNVLSFSVAENASQWHCLVARRVGDTIYASIDGKQTDGTTAGESSLTMADWAVPPTSATESIMGDFRTGTPPMAFDSIVIVQDELTLQEAQKLMGWAMWRRGIEAQLPVSHPYRNAAPLSAPSGETFTESTAGEWTTLKETYWDVTNLSEQYKGTVLSLDGWTVAFEDQFNTHSVTNDVTGKGNWFAPVHGNPCGAATAVQPALNGTNAAVGTQGTPATYIQSGTTMTIRMQNSSGWKSGAFCSVNKNGYGQTWMYPYIEVRMKASSTGNHFGAWPALWVKSINEFYRLTESRLEYDIYEGYISDPQALHNSLHNWPAYRQVAGRLTDHRYVSNYLGLKTSTGGWHENVDLFDNQYHTYGVMVTPDWVINTFDGRETFRFPTPVEMMQPLWILIDLAMLPNEVSSASGTYDLTIDYIKVYQNSAYAP